MFGYVPVQSCDTQTHSEVTRRCDSRCSHTSCLGAHPADVAVSQSVSRLVCRVHVEYTMTRRFRRTRQTAVRLVIAGLLLRRSIVQSSDSTVATSTHTRWHHVHSDATQRHSRHQRHTYRKLLPPSLCHLNQTHNVSARLCGCRADSAHYTQPVEYTLHTAHTFSCSTASYIAHRATCTLKPVRNQSMTSVTNQ